MGRNLINWIQDLRRRSIRQFLNRENSIIQSKNRRLFRTAAGDSFPNPTFQILSQNFRSNHLFKQILNMLRGHSSRLFKYLKLN